jgi:hypothetical protein
MTLKKGISLGRPLIVVLVVFWMILIVSHLILGLSESLQEDAVEIEKEDLIETEVVNPPEKENEQEELQEIDPEILKGEWSEQG